VRRGLSNFRSTLLVWNGVVTMSARRGTNNLIILGNGTFITRSEIPVMQIDAGGQPTNFLPFMMAITHVAGRFPYGQPVVPDRP